MERHMIRLMCVVGILVATLPLFSQSVSNYQVGTITEVKDHQATGDRSDIVSYDVSVRVGDTIYQVVYTPPLGASPIKYAAGRNLLVVVSEKTIRYNNIVGESVEVPIVGRKPARYVSQSKQASESGPTK